MAGNHDNHYTTRHLIRLGAEDKLNTTFAGHNRKKVLIIEQMKGTLLWQFKQIAPTKEEEEEKKKKKKKRKKKPLLGLEPA